MAVSFKYPPIPGLPSAVLYANLWGGIVVQKAEDGTMFVVYPVNVMVGDAEGASIGIPEITRFKIQGLSPDAAIGRSALYFDLKARLTGLGATEISDV